MVSVSMPPPLSWIVIDPGLTAIEITGATSASSHASSALSISSLSTTSGQSWSRVSGLILQFPPGAELHEPRDLEGHPGQLRCAFAFPAGSPCPALPQFVKTEAAWSIF